jgi:hypothetical protein
MVFSYLLEPSQITQVWLPGEPLDVPEPPLPRYVATSQMALGVAGPISLSIQWVHVVSCMAEMQTLL